MLTTRPRLCANPTISVADLMEPLDKFMEREGDTNVWKLVKPPETVTWKGGCPTGWLTSLNELFKAYVAVAPNTILSSKKHRQALMRLVETKQINKTKKGTEDFCDAVDDCIRMGLSHLRILKQQPEKKEAALRKCDKRQHEALEEILALVKVEVEKQETQLVAFQAQGDSQASEQGDQAEPSPSNTPKQSNMKTAASTSKSAESIFDSVLKQDSDGENIPITYLKPDKTPETAKQDSPHKSSMFSLEVSQEETMLLKSAAEASPIAKGDKSQNQRMNANAPPKKKGPKKKNAKKAKEQSKAGSKGSKKKADEELGGRSCMKRPSAAPTSLADKEDEEVLKKHIPNQVVELAMKKAMELSPEELPRETRRQRTTSNAYHRCEQILMKDGMSKGDAQAVGRVAGRMAGAEFDKSWPLAKAKAKAKAKSSSSKAKAKKKTEKKTANKKIKQSEVETKDETKTEEGINESFRDDQESDSRDVD